MRKKNNALRAIEQTQRNTRESIEKQFAIALALADDLYLKIPKGKWKEFFDKSMKFGIGLNTTPSALFLHQSNRIRAVEKLASKKGIIELFQRRNFNRLIEVLLHPFYEKSATAPIAIPHKVSAEIPENFSFTEEEFLELQKAFMNDLLITKKFGTSSDRDNQQRKAVFFEFSLRIKK
jgi:hypothetical protein